MEPFSRLSSHLVPIDRDNVDTDAILPKQYMAMITREGFGEFLFDSWRYRETGAPGRDNSGRTPQADFALNNPAYAGARILLARKNFGCGSSREHAVWALAQYGIRALIAPSFADIFYGNCMKNGILPVRLPAHAVDRMFETIAVTGRLELTVDLPSQQVIDASGAAIAFDIDAMHKSSLLQGLDDIGRILAESSDALQAMRARRLAEEPWLLKK
jgi:3-isopropylmalate/(R)-2-methylmalate dehydratase small subunit